MVCCASEFGHAVCNLLVSGHTAGTPSQRPKETAMAADEPLRPDILTAGAPGGRWNPMGDDD